MAVISRFLNKWLSPDEEEKLKIQSRRVFCIGALSTLALAAAPAGMMKLGNLWVPDDSLWHPVMAINWSEAQQFDANLKSFPAFAGFMDQVIDEIKRDLKNFSGIRPEDVRVGWEDNPHSQQKILRVECLGPVRPLWGSTRIL